MIVRAWMLMDCAATPAIPDERWIFDTIPTAACKVESTIWGVIQ
jgi:hypothetical protein